MKSLKYKQLHVISDTLKAGNQFELNPRLTLIKANENDVGKSTLAKLLLWALGCEPFFDSTWKSTDCKTILEFEIDKRQYVVYRYKSCIKFVDISQSKRYIFTKISGDYSKLFNNLVGFKALLPNRNSEELESPPPAYYFSPYYIDQKKSWSKAWDNFSNFGQYSNWYKTVINYHIGLLTPKHFEIEEDINENKKEAKFVKDYIEKLDTASTVIKEYIPNTNSTLQKDEFAEMTHEVKDELYNLSKNQEEILEKISLNEGDRAFVVQQISISQNIIKQLEADYKFAVENIHEDTFECPLCGVEHENSVVNRASILTDKDNASKQLLELSSELDEIDNRRIKYQKQIIKIENEIDRINTKYINTEYEQEINISTAIEIIATNSINEKIRRVKEKQLTRESALKKEYKDYRNEQKNILTREEKEDILNFFNETLTSYILMLEAEGVNLSNINKPTDHAKIVKEGGAATGTRGILAYYLTIYTLIEKHGNEVLSPLIIDTPNQHEQSLKNYKSIIEIILKRLPSNSQIILCAMDNQQLKPFESIASVIRLDENKILSRQFYKKVKMQFEAFDKDIASLN